MSHDLKESLIKEFLFLLYVNSDLDPQLIESRYEEGYYHMLSIEDLQQKISQIQETVSNEYLYNLQ